MPKVTPLQNSFSAGEVSPLLHARVDTTGYQSGLATMTNFIASSHGPAMARCGSQHQQTLTGDTGKGFSMPVSTSKYYACLLVNGTLHIYENDNTLKTTFAIPYAAGEERDVHFVSNPSGTAIYLFHVEHAPRKLVYTRSTDSFAFSTVSFTAQPAAWGASNYPSCGTFFQGRLWVAGTVNEPETFWGSKSAAHENFTTGSLADDALEFTLQKHGRITWMKGTKNLLIGTHEGEHIVTSDAGVIVPGDIQVEQQSAYGSSSVQPVLVGDQVFYVSPDRTKLRAMQYEWTANNWLSKDLTFFSEHITQAHIVDVAWQQNPSNRLWCVLEDGSVALLTYERGESVWGWSKYETDGAVIDVHTEEYLGHDRVILLVQRNSGELELELSIPEGNLAFMDSWVSASGTALTSVSGLDHLDGKTVQVLADGAVHPDATVAAGSITLSYPADEVYVGLPYTCTLVTLPLDKGANAGSALPHFKRYNKIYVSLLDSAKPLINGTRPPVRHPSTPMGTPEPVTTSKVLSVATGWDLNAQITIEQDLPLACTVLGIAGEVAQEIT